MDIEERSYKAFLIITWVTVTIFVVGVFVGIAFRTKYLLYDEMMSQAKAHLRSIIIMRKWNSDYGGVYVEKKDGVQSNPYLKELLVDADIVTVDGKTYTMKNPALMTREISEYAMRDGLYQFHITSLSYLNPQNAPDRFERGALLDFEKGKAEVFTEEEREDGAYFRYMEPLYVEEGCLDCHGAQGYKLGDVRGGISVTFSIQDKRDQIRTNFIIIATLGVASLALLTALIYGFTVRLKGGISDARSEIERLAAIDGLTEVSNRRHAMALFEKEISRSRRFNTELSCLIIDVDNFKGINDTFGHVSGDRVLKGIAELVTETVRTFNVVGRYGGDEFILVLQETSAEGARTLAGRIRANVKNSIAEKAGLPGGQIVTVSIGGTLLSDSDELVDDVIKRADEGLYKAKEAGRDRVEWA